MKSAFHFALVAALSICPLFAQEAAKPPADPFEEGMRQAFTAYKKGDNEAVSTKLHDLLKILDEKSAAKMGDLLPATVGNWKAEAVKNEDLGADGGVGVSRLYVAGAQKITVRVVKNSPVIGQLAPLLVNDDLLRMANRKTHSISGEKGIMDGDNKLQIIVDQRLLVELETVEGAAEADLVALAEKLDLKAIAKIK